MRGDAMENRAFYQCALARTEDHILMTEKHVARQRLIIAEKQQGGTDSGLSQSLLETFEMLLVQHKGHRDSLLRSLAEFSKA
jgi:hypothetical protein